MPNNWTEPTHTIPARVLDSGDWPAAARAALLRNRVADPEEYRRWLQTATVDIWETTYHQELTGPDPVLTWVKGSVLRPVMATLAPSDSHRFEERCRKLYAEAYVPDEQGIVTLPFRRLFMIATAMEDAPPVVRFTTARP
jgi:trans-aconitate 2-methyltransferase